MKSMGYQGILNRNLPTAFGFSALLLALLISIPRAHADGRFSLYLGTPGIVVAPSYPPPGYGYGGYPYAPPPVHAPPAYQRGAWVPGRWVWARHAGWIWQPGYWQAPRRHHHRHDRDDDDRRHWDRD